MMTDKQFWLWLLSSFVGGFVILALIEYFTSRRKDCARQDPFKKDSVELDFIKPQPSSKLLQLIAEYSGKQITDINKYWFTDSTVVVLFDRIHYPRHYSYTDLYDYYFKAADK